METKFSAAATRLAITYARQGTKYRAADYLRWAFFHSGRVSLLACDSSATNRMLDRSGLVQQIVSRASTLTMNRLSRAE